LLLCKIEVNDPGTPALTDACARESHAGLPKPACAPNEGSLLGIGNKLVTLYYTSAPIISGSEVDYVGLWRGDRDQNLAAASGVTTAR
jgi:hypothetical protein